MKFTVFLVFETIKVSGGFCSPVCGVKLKQEVLATLKEKETPKRLQPASVLQSFKRKKLI